MKPYEIKTLRIVNEKKVRGYEGENYDQYIRIRCSGRWTDQ